MPDAVMFRNRKRATFGLFPRSYRLLAPPSVGLAILAPDIQEQILFLPLLPGLNERNLRPIARTQITPAA